MIKKNLVDGKKISDLPFEFIERPDVVINIGEAKKNDYEFPSTIVGKATVVIKTE